MSAPTIDAQAIRVALARARVCLPHLTSWERHATHAFTRRAARRAAQRAEEALLIAGGLRCPPPQSPQPPPPSQYQRALVEAHARGLQVLVCGNRLGLRSGAA